MSWEDCVGFPECAASVIIQPWMTVIVIPILALFFGGLAKWILARGKLIRDYFLLGIELTLTSLALSFTNMFDWIRVAATTPRNVDLDYPPVILSGATAFVSMVMLLIVIALMGAYVDKKAGPGRSSIDWGWFLLINALGAIPLGITAALLIG